jgi:3-dehydroquinate dehydratase-1
MAGNNSFLQQQHQHSDQNKKQRNGSIAQRQPQKNHARADNDAQPDHRPQNLHDRFPLRLIQRRLIKSLQVEQDRTERHDDDKEPGVISQRIDRSQTEPKRAVKTQRVRAPKRKREQERVDQHLQLRIYFLSSGEHVRKGEVVACSLISGKYMTTRRQVKKPPATGCIVGVIASLADLRFGIQMNRPPDLFELRLDHLVRVIEQVESKLSMLAAPLIITARDPREGGANKLNAKERSQLLERFLPFAEGVDVELRSASQFNTLLNRARRKHVCRIVSFHDFNSTPQLRSLCAKIAAAKNAGADIFKIAARTETLAQLGRLLHFVVNNEDGLPISAMGMGKLGGISRILLARCGSVLNYASLARSSVPGQLSVEQLRLALAR